MNGYCPECFEPFEDDSTDPALGGVDFLDGRGNYRICHWSCGVMAGWKVVQPTDLPLDDDVKIQILVNRARALKTRVDELTDEVSEVRCEVSGLLSQLYD